MRSGESDTGDFYLSQQRETSKLHGQTIFSKKIPATPSRSITTQAIIDTCKTPKNANDSLLTVADSMDVLAHTPIRLLQVGGNVWANWSDNQAIVPVSDADNSHSVFNELVYIDPSHTDQGLTPVGYTFASLSALPVLYGISRRIYQVKHKLELNSYGYLKKRLNASSHELGLNQKFKKSEIIDGFDDILRKNQVDLNPWYHPVNQKDEKAFEPNALIQVVNTIKEFYPVKLAGDIWDFLSDQSLIFWIVGFPIGIAAGAAAATQMPLILAITFSIGALYLTYKGSQYIYNNITQSNDADQQDDGSELEINKLKQHYFMQQEHNLLMKMLNEQYQVADEDTNETINFSRKICTDAENWYELDKLSNKVIRVNKKSSKLKVSTSTDFKLTPQQTLSSELGTYLLGSQYERNARLAVTTLGTVISGFTAAIFVLWLAASTAGVFPAAAGVAAFLSGTEFTFFTSAAIGTLFGVSTYSKLRTEQLNYEKKVYQTLSSEYKNEGITKLQKFTTLQFSIEKKKNEVISLRKNLQSHGKGDDQHLLAKYDINKIDVYNDYYFEKQKNSPSLTTRIKKGFNRVYNFFAGGQTGIFVVRTLLLAGGIAAGSIAAASTGALIPFLIIAGIAALTVGGIKLAQYQLDRNQQHREGFVDTIDLRINYLELKNQELDAVIGKLQKNVIENKSKLEQIHHPLRTNIQHVNDVRKIDIVSTTNSVAVKKEPESKTKTFQQEDMQLKCNVKKDQEETIPGFNQNTNIMRENEKFHQQDNIRSEKMLTVKNLDGNRYEERMKIYRQSGGLFQSYDGLLQESPENALNILALPELPWKLT